MPVAIQERAPRSRTGTRLQSAAAAAVFCFAVALPAGAQSALGSAVMVSTLPEIAADRSQKDMDNLLAQAAALADVPGTPGWMSSCRARPLETARSLGLPIESAVPRAASLLCSRELKDCPGLMEVVSTHRGTHLPHMDLLHMDELEEIPEDIPECRAWASSFFYLDSILEKKPDQASCRIFVEGIHLGFKSPVSEDVCGGITKGLLTGDVGYFCRQLISHVGAESLAKMGGETNLDRLCRTEFGYVGGGACDGLKRPRALSQCRLWHAYRAGDTALCDGDPFCLAFFQKQGCDESRFVGLEKNPAWEAICPALRDAALARGPRDVESRSRSVQAGLLRYRQELPDGLSQDQREVYSKRVEAALSSLDETERSLASYLQGSTAAAAGALSVADRSPSPDVRQAGPGAAAAAVGRVGIQWIEIPGGSFVMGSDKDRERPAHKVAVPAFELARAVVTNKQYKLCVAAGACTPPDDCGKEFDGDNQPVVCVDWYQAQAFSKWVGGRLPSEAEWEYAARSAGKDWEYPWGNAPATCDRAVIAGCETGRGAPLPVCSKPAGNTLQGLCDMAGNVWQWVADWHHYSYDGAPADGSAWDDSGLHRMARGGCWLLDAAHARTRYRHYYDPDWRPFYMGFRPARNAAGAD